MKRRTSTQPPTERPIASPRNPLDARRGQISSARKVERAAASTYKDAVARVNACDPLCADYEANQKNLEFAAEALLTSRQLLRDALFGLEVVSA